MAVVTMFNFSTVHKLFYRERRKSASNRHFYPIEDEGEDDIFSPKSEQEQSSPANRLSGRFHSSATGREDPKVRTSGVLWLSNHAEKITV